MPSGKVGRAIAWAFLVFVFIVALYQFWPDGSSEAGVPAGVSSRVRRAMARLQSRRSSRRCEAAFELGRLQAAAAVPRLVTLLSDEQEAMGPLERLMQTLMFGGLSRPVWGCAGTALHQIGPGATTALIEAFANPDARVRVRATNVLALSTDPKAVAFFSERLQDPDPYIRRKALISVAQGGAPGKAAAIRRAFYDPDAEVRALAVDYAEPVLGAWAHDALLRASQDPNAWVRQRAADRLRWWPRP